MANLRGVRVKIDRAKKHLADLEAAVIAYVAGEPWKAEVVKHDPEPGRETYYFRLLTAISDEWGAILGDCVHNLRSALDLLSVELIKAGGGVPGDYTGFPIGSDLTNFKTSAITRIKGASADTIKLICRLKPYGGGNEAISRLHRLDIADKHKLLIPVAAAQNMLGVRYDVTDSSTKGRPRGPMVRGEPIDRKFPLKDGDILLSYPRVRLPFEDKSEFDFGFEIAFGEGQIFDGEAVIPTLTKLVDFTERLIDIFARRILKISW